MPFRGYIQRGIGLFRRRKKGHLGSTIETSAALVTSEQVVYCQSSEFGAKAKGRDDRFLSEADQLNGGVHQPGDVQPTPSPAGTSNNGIEDAGSSGENHHNQNLWAEAYEILQGDPEYCKLLPKFEEYLEDDKEEAPDDTEEQGVASDDAVEKGTERLDSIQRLARRKLEALPDARLAFSINKRSVVVRDVVLKAIKLVSSFKDVVNAAISSDPHAALAWAGVLFVLPILENSFQQDEDAANGLQNILFLLIRYEAMMEGGFSPRYWDSSTRRLLSDVRTRVVNIFTKVYMYMMRFVLQYARKKGHQLCRNIATADDWRARWEEIEKESQLVDRGIQHHADARTLETWKEVHEFSTRIVNIENSQQAILTVVQATHQAQLLRQLPFAGNAIFDSRAISSLDAPCLKGTQRSILNDIQDWAENPAGEAIFWLHGMAGTGKTSIALTVANALKNGQSFADNRDQPPVGAFIGASFFFKQADASRNGTKDFFTTLARCLADTFPDLESHIASAISRNLGIETKAQQQQLSHLIIKPLGVLDGQTYLPIRLVVIVDALDECINPNEAEELLGMLQSLETLHQVRLRFLITSRREKHIAEGFRNLSENMCRASTLEKIDPSATGEGQEDDDITFYLRHKLAEVCQKRGFPHAMVKQDDIERLSQKVDGLFVYASTAYRFLDADDLRISWQERLDQIFDDERDVDTPQQKVDEIYIKVLSFPGIARFTHKSKQMMYDWTGTILGFIAVLCEPVVVSSLCHLVDLERNVMDEVLRRLHSVVDVPEDENTPLGLVHLSFRDFLLCEERSKQLKFQVKEVSMHRKVFEHCIDIMSENLHEDMCNLKFPGSFTTEVPEKQLEQNVPQHLRYACRYWVDHLAQIDDIQREEVGLKDRGAVHTFLQKNLLFWLETMGLIQAASTAIIMINHLEILIKSTDNRELSCLISDARRFILSYKWVIDHAPLQIYCSALIFSPKQSIVRCQFKHLIPSWITQMPIVEEVWSPRLLALIGHAELVSSVASSPLDDFVVSGSWDGTTRIWDSVTGSERFRFKGASKTNCVAFSPDGKNVVSGYEDGIIKVREFTKGRVVDLIGHSKKVTDIAFFPKSSNLVISASMNCTIRIWNVDERRESYILRTRGGDPMMTEVYPMKMAVSPDGNIVALAFSPNNEGIAMTESLDGKAEYNGEGLNNNFVKLMNVEKRELVETLEADASYISAGAFALNGEYVAIGSHSSTLRLWDVAAGRISHETRYDGYVVTAIASSPTDENLLAIGLWGGIVELRRVDNWALAAKLTLGSLISSMAFSGHGKNLVVASSGGRVNVEICDLTNITNEFERKGHKFSIHSMHRIPGDDNAILSLGSDGAKLWKAGWVNPHLHLRRVRRVISGLRGGLVALICEDNTIQFWDEGMTRVVISFDGWDIARFSPGRTYIGLYSPGKLRIFRCTTFEEIATFDTELRNWGFSSSEQILGLMETGMFRLWDLAAKRELMAHPWHEGTDYFKLSPNRELLALQLGGTGPKCPKNIILLEVATGKEIGVLDDTIGERSFEVFHPESHLFAVSKNNSHISVWDTASGKKKYHLLIDHPSGRQWSVAGLDISACGKLLAGLSWRIGEKDIPGINTIHMWDTNSGIETSRLNLHITFFYPRFSNDYLSILTTGDSQIPWPPPLPNQGSASAELLEATQRCVYLNGNWVVQGFDRLLWLPMQYRSQCYTASAGEIGLGHAHGLISVLNLDLDKTPLSGQLPSSASCPARLVDTPII